MKQSFLTLGIPPDIVNVLIRLGYEKPTPIQAQSIPHLLAGRDILASAQTGTGKTAAFSLPIITKLLNNPCTLSPKQVRALVLAPTRELAAQIHENICTYTKESNIRSVICYGGVNIHPQTKELAKGTDFLIATPGRLLDHAGQLNVDLSTVEFFVLDEADRMLDMGFIRDIKRIAKLLPKKHQTLLFSATFNSEIEKLTKEFLNNPVQIEISRNTDNALVHQEAWAIDRAYKRLFLRDLIVDNQWDQVLVFTRMKHVANRLAMQLQRDGLNSVAIHGNKGQSARLRALHDFKTKTARVLVATDIAARGLDIEGLPHVVNFDLPDMVENYVHRIGRTGRAGVPGHAVSLISPDDLPQLKAIEKLIGKRIVLHQYTPSYTNVDKDEQTIDLYSDQSYRGEKRRERFTTQKGHMRTKKSLSQSQKLARANAIEVEHEAKRLGISNNASDRFEKKVVRTNSSLTGTRLTSSVKTPVRHNSTGQSKLTNHQNCINTNETSTHQQFRRRNSTIQTTVKRRRPNQTTSSSSGRMESVSSNLPPELTARFRRR